MREGFSRGRGVLESLVLFRCGILGVYWDDVRNARVVGFWSG